MKHEQMTIIQRMDQDALARAMRLDAVGVNDRNSRMKYIQGKPRGDDGPHRSILESMRVLLEGMPIENLVDFAAEKGIPRGTYNRCRTHMLREGLAKTMKVKGHKFHRLSITQRGREWLAES